MTGEQVTGEQVTGAAEPREGTVNSAQKTGASRTVGVHCRERVYPFRHPIGKNKSAQNNKPNSGTNLLSKGGGPSLATVEDSSKYVN